MASATTQLGIETMADEGELMLLTRRATYDDMSNLSIPDLKLMEKDIQKLIADKEEDEVTDSRAFIEKYLKEKGLDILRLYPEFDEEEHAAYVKQSIADGKARTAAQMAKDAIKGAKKAAAAERKAKKLGAVKIEIGARYANPNDPSDIWEKKPSGAPKLWFRDYVKTGGNPNSIRIRD